MNGKRDEGRTLVYHEVIVSLTGGNDIALGSNQNRVGLMLCASTTGNIVRWQLSEDTTSNPAIAIGGATVASTPFVLFGEHVRGCITGPIRARGTAGQATVIGEWYYAG